MTKLTQLATAVAVVVALCALNANVPLGLAQDSMGGNMTMEANATTPTFNVSYAVQLFQAAGLNVENSTIFVPDNDAFNALPLELSNITDLLNDTLSSNSSFILGLHVVPGVWRSSDFPVGNLTLNTTAGIPITIDNEPTGVLIFVPGSDVQAYVEQADIPFMTNVLHIIDTVLLPFPTSNDVIIEAPANSTDVGTPPL